MKPKRPAQDPGGEDVTRLIGRVGVAVGIVTGVAGVVGAIAFELLPTSTVTDKVLVTAAWLAISVAFFWGIGAWKSARRFTITSISALVSMICLAALSIAAQNSMSPTENHSHQSPITSPSFPSSASPSQQATAHPTTKPAAAPQVSKSLANLTPVTSSEYNSVDGSYQVGSQTLNGRQYQQAIYDELQGLQGSETVCDGASGTADYSTYYIGYKYRNFSATIGLADSSAPGYTITFTVLVNNQQKSSVKITNPRKTDTINIPVSGASLITLEDTCQNQSLNAVGSDYMYQGDIVTAVWANPTVSG
jgi:NPCBM/NEW2 domain